MNDPAAHIIVSGLVQGVGYRYFASRKADELGVTGFVRNIPDGRVEIVARGDRGLIAELVALLKVGPRAARVRDVAVNWIDSGERFDRFEVR
jgi:acylphosphatase